VNTALGLAYYDDATAERELSDRPESAWRAVDDQDPFTGDVDLAKDMLWLECDFEFIEASSVTPLGVRRAPLGAKLVRFVCPRCGQHHESLHFR
jgi:hypothetical protein